MKLQAPSGYMTFTAFTVGYLIEIKFTVVQFTYYTVNLHGYLIEIKIYCSSFNSHMVTGNLIETMSVQCSSIYILHGQFTRLPYINGS